MLNSEKRPEVSIVTCAARPGGLDVLLAGLKQQTFKDFEVIMVDHRYEKRHKIVQDAFNEAGIKLIHVPEHRRNYKWISLAAGWNTGFMLARGRVVIMLVDYAFTPVGWIENHLKWHNDPNNKKMIVAPHAYTDMPPLKITPPSITIETFTTKYVEWIDDEKLDEFSIFTEPFTTETMKTLAVTPPPYNDPKILMSEGYTYRDFSHMKNESFLLESVLNVNGIDEHGDLGKGPVDREFGNRMEKNNDRMYLYPPAIIYVPNPRFILPGLPWGMTHERVHVEGDCDRWSFDDGFKWEAKRFNEVDHGINQRAYTPYDMEKKIKELESWRTEVNIDMSKLDKTNKEYFGEEECKPIQ